MKYFIYKYVYQDDIIYIGKTIDLPRRIAEHASGQGIESKFNPYLKECEIYYHQCCNELEMDAVERLLINHFKPVLNDVDIFPELSTIQIEVDWLYYSELDDKLPSHRIEELIKLCDRNILSNETRIKHYSEESASIGQKIAKLRPFYEFLDTHKDEFLHKIDDFILIERCIIPDSRDVYIGSQLVEEWYSEIAEGDSEVRVKLDLLLLKRLYEVAHRDSWIEETLQTVGTERVRIINEKTANLRRRNCELESKKEALKIILDAKN